MKRSTVSSLKRMNGIITLMLTITVAVGLLPLVSTTVDAAEMYELPYILCMTDEASGLSLVYASSGPIRVLSTSNSTSSAYVKGLASYNTIYMVQISYSEELQDWVTVKNDYTMYVTDEPYYIYGTSTRVSSGTPVYWHMQDDYNSVSIITNSAMNSYEQALFAGYSDDLSTLPQGLTESTIQSLIDQQLNTQTQAGIRADQLKENTENNYSEYQKGNLNSTEMQMYLETNADMLNDLVPETLLDAIKINNSLQYNQLINDIVANASSDAVQNYLIELIEPAIDSAAMYYAGFKTQHEAMLDVSSAIGSLLSMISFGEIRDSADLAATNAAINALNALSDNLIAHRSDLDVDVAAKSLGSDTEEKDYLEQLQTNTNGTTITDIAPSKTFTATQKSDAKELMDVIWENEFVKRLVPLCAGFMVVCVALGVKYKV